MTLSQRLDLRQSQSLVMTPQLQQAIKLLQMSSIEVADFVADEIEKNPLLEKSDSPDLSDDSFHEDASIFKDDHVDGADKNLAEPQILNGALVHEESYSGAGQDEAGDGLFASSGAKGNFEDTDSLKMEVVATGLSLRDHLQGQIQVDFLDSRDRKMALDLIEYLDDAGYLQVDQKELMHRWNVDAPYVEDIIQRVQKLDPVGIFARSLTECLSLQLREKNRLDPAMEKMLTRLDLVAKKDKQSLMSLCRVDAEDIEDMFDEIRSLNPKPAESFTVELAAAVTPDVFVFLKQDGGWHIELNAENLPRLIANERYYADVQKATKNKEEKTYLSEQWQQANWLVKALRQRANTILKVTTEIVKQQENFFAHGVQFLKPIGLKDIAAATELHESTVSRVTQNKYMATPRGLFELKYFFTTAIATTGGIENVSANAVRARIKELVDSEKPNAILSDDKLTALLRREGISIARRTVAKYREAMGIPSSSLRRSG